MRLISVASMVAVMAEMFCFCFLHEYTFSEIESNACLFKGGNKWGEGQLTVWTSGETEIPENCQTSYEWKILDQMKVPFNYTNWIFLEPSCGDGNEYCTQIVKGNDDSYQWNDLNCSNKTCALCEL